MVAKARRPKDAELRQKRMEKECLVAVDDIYGPLAL
jgi:hypothetical protein